MVVWNYLKSWLLLPWQLLIRIWGSKKKYLYALFWFERSISINFNNKYNNNFVMKTHISITNTELYLIYTMINYDIMLIGTQFRIIAQNNATVRVRSDSKNLSKVLDFQSDARINRPPLFIARIFSEISRIIREYIRYQHLDCWASLQLIIKKHTISQPAHPGKNPRGAPDKPGSAQIPHNLSPPSMTVL